MEKKLTEQFYLERLKYYFELLRLLWISVLTVGWGSIGFVVTTITPLKVFFASLGFAATVFLGISLINLTRRISQTLNEIKEIKDEHSWNFRFDYWYWCLSCVWCYYLADYEGNDLMGVMIGILFVFLNRRILKHWI